MQSGVLALFVEDVDFHFFRQAELSAVGKLHAFEIGGEYVVGFPGGNALGEFAVMVGVLIPANFFRLVGGTPNSYVHTVDGKVVGTPDRTEDERVGLLLLRGGGQRAYGGAKQNCDQQKLEEESRSGPGGFTNSHRLRFPLRLLLRLRSLPRRPSTPGDWR